VIEELKRKVEIVPIESAVSAVGVAANMLVPLYDRLVGQKFQAMDYQVAEMDRRTKGLKDDAVIGKMLSGILWSIDCNAWDELFQYLRDHITIPFAQIAIRHMNEGKVVACQRSPSEPK
jgi:hypothetical protein